MEAKPKVGERYQLEAELGRGAMGAVYRAVDRLTGTVVALKVVLGSSELLHLDTSQGGVDLRLSLSREFQALSTLQHPYVIGVWDYGFDERREPFFTMEYLPEARMLLEAGKGVSESVKITWLVQLLQALVYIHRQGIVHRDLKPSNVLISEGRVKVLDFGLAALSGGSRGISGSLAYMAPEILSGASAGPASDLYAVGMMAYELFAGFYPFATQDFSALLDAILEEEPDFNQPGISPELAPVLRRLTAKDPALRYADARTVIQDLEGFLTGELRDETGAIRESFLQSATFVGRNVELAALQSALQAARGGQGSSWLIGGESGVGKSRLLRELRTRALVQGCVVLEGRTVAQGGLLYQLWRDPARWLAVSGGPNDLEAGVLRALLPDIEQLVGRPVAEAPFLEPQAARARLLGVMNDLLRRCAGRAPVLLLLEDLHWAGDGSLAFLQWLNRQVGSMPVLIVGSYRDDEVPDLPKRLPEMRVLKLGRLAMEATSDLCAAMLGPVGRRPELVSFLQRETEGNAFFLVEIMRALAEEAGQLELVDERQVGESLLIGGVAAVVRRRLERVPDWAFSLLQLAAVAGRRINRIVMRAAVPDEDLDRWLRVCANAVVLEQQDGQWQFVHDKLREGTLESTVPIARRALHQQIGLAMESVYQSELMDHAVALAYHFGEAGDAVRECRYALLAGLVEAEQYANQRALDYLNRVLALAPDSDKEIRYTALLTRVKVYRLVASREEQRADLEALDRLVVELGGNQREAEVALQWVEYVENTRDYDAAMVWIERSIAAARRDHDEMMEARALIRGAHLLCRLGRYHEAPGWLERALALSPDNPIVQTGYVRGMGVVCSYLGQYAEFRVWAERALELAQRLGDRRGMAAAYNELGRQTLDQYFYGQCQYYFSMALEVYREIGDRVGEGILLGNLGNTYVGLGMYPEARVCYEQAIQIRREIQHPHLEALGLITMARMYHHQGESAAGESCAREGLAKFQQLKSRVLEGWGWLELGVVLEGMGRWDESAAAYQASLEVHQELGELNLATEPWAGLARVALAQGEVAKAQLFVEAILAYLAGGGLLDGADDPLWVELTCYKVLKAAGDERAAEVLTRARGKLLTMLADIKDEAMQQSFLEKVPFNRELLAAQL